MSVPDKVMKLKDGKILYDDLRNRVNNSAPVIKNTASGAIASFSDGAEGRPIDSLVVNIEPVQDLHGYDSPWPAGGGKNLLHVTADDGNLHSGMMFTTNADGTIKVTGTSSGNASLFGTATLPAGTYTFSHGSNLAGFYLNMPGVVNSSTTGTNFTLSEDRTVEIRLYPPAAGTVVDGYLEPMIRLSTSAAGYAPYSNECPITGWTGANVQATGFNLWDGSYESGNILSDGTDGASGVYNRSGYISVVPGINYYWKSGQSYSRFYWYDRFKNFISLYNQSNICQAPENARYMRTMWSTSVIPDPSTAEICLNISDPLLNDQYSPYHGRTIQVEFPSEAGTVYGCKLTVNKDRTGSLKVDRVKIVFDGSQSIGTTGWRNDGKTAGWLYNKEITPGAVDVQTTAQNLDNIICDKLEVMPYSSGLYSGIRSGIAWVSVANYGIGMRVNNPSLNTAEKINAWLAENPITVIYKLVEPITYVLTAEQIQGILSTLKGQNNIWADCGNIDNVIYSADTKLYSDFHTALVQDVQINGTSILNNGVANVPKASQNNVGVVKVSVAYGTSMIGDGTITTQQADYTQVKNGQGSYRPITPNIQERSTFYGLAKAAGDSTQSASSNAVGVYTDEAKAAIKSMLGITDGIPDPVEVSGATPTITATKDTRYVCGEVSTLTVTPSASGICIVRFTSGATPTVLTATDVVWPEWFDVNNLEANTVYEICITDGVYGAVMTWPQTS